MAYSIRMLAALLLATAYLAQNSGRVGDAEADSTSHQVALSPPVTSAARSSIRYDIRLEGSGAVKRARYKYISKRNSAAFKNLKPGTYTSRYRVIQTASKGSPRRTTPFSPRQKVTIT
jgi:hypothetical protein